MKTKNINPIQGRAMLQPETWNEESRTIEVVFATPQPVLRYSWDEGGYFNEVLSMDSEHIRMQRIESGAPVLDSHDTWGGLGSQIGVVERAWIQGGEMRAELRLSERESLKEIVNDIKSGIIRNISVGYRVYKYEKVESGIEAMPTYRATDWEPYEISFVTVPADHKSGVRSAQEQTNEVIIIEPEPAPVAQENQNQMEDKNNVNAEELQRNAIEAERKRTSDILDLVRVHQLGDEFGSELVKNGKSIEQVRELVLDKLAERSPKIDNVTASAGKDIAVEHEKRSIEASFLLRSNQTDCVKANFTKDEITEANKIKSRSALEMAERSLKRAGVNTEHMSKMEIAGRAITQTTSDFPVLLENALNKTLQTAYELASDSWRQFCAVGTLTDFREHKRYRLGQFGKLEKVVEGGEYKYVQIPDGESEKIKGDTYGNLINLSRQTIINDDLGAFLSLASQYGAAAGLTIEETVYALLLENGGLGPIMSDGLPLFDAAHRNIATTTALSVAGLDVDRVKMAQQKDPNNKRFLNIRPYALVLPVGLGGAARVLNQSQFDNDSSGNYAKPNVVAGLFSEIVDTPYLAGTRRYVFANPSQVPALEVAFLDGNQSPFLEMQEAFNQDGKSWKIRLDFGAAAIDWRGAVTNPG
jgi:phage major head subunit gpT-like protein